MPYVFEFAFSCVNMLRVQCSLLSIADSIFEESHPPVPSILHTYALAKQRCKHRTLAQNSPVGNARLQQCQKQDVR